jgi:predicted RNA-binding protein
MGKPKKYWLDLFSLKTWEEFEAAGTHVSGFRASREKTVSKISVGDLLVCYLTGLSRFVGILEVESEPYLENSKIWEDDIFPVRLKVRPVVMLNPETAVPVLELKEKLSFFKDLKFPSAWAVYFRASPFKLKESDANVIVEAIWQASRNPVHKPFDKAKLKSKPKGIESKIGQVVVPETEETALPRQDLQKETSAHTEVQSLLLRLGSEMGYDVWVAKNDRGKGWNGKTFLEMFPIPDHLPVQFDEATNRTIELIDVLWFKKNAVIAAFEIESTTSVHSGLLRMSDLISMQPNINIALYIVAPDERRSKVLSEINRPTFSKLEQPLSSICRFIPFSALKGFVQKHEALLKHLKPDVVASDELSESCELDGF